jgi:hypothetical protein
MKSSNFDQLLVNWPMLMLGYFQRRLDDQALIPEFDEAELDRRSKR